MDPSFLSEPRKLADPSAPGHLSPSWHTAMGPEIRAKEIEPCIGAGTLSGTRISSDAHAAGFEP